MSATDGKLSRRDELESLLPFYLNGTLEGSELAAVEEWLASDPMAATALADAEAELSGTVFANEAVRPPADALSRFNKSLDALSGPSPASAGSLRRFWNALAAIPSGVAWAALAAFVAFMLVQAVLVPGERGDHFEIAGEKGGTASMPFALVTFRPDARIADIAAFLAGNGAAIIGGPAGGGVFRIGIGAATGAEYDRLLGLIAAQPFTESAAAGRRPGNGG